MSMEVKRRELLKFAAGGAVAGGLALHAQEHRFFTKAEFETLEEFTEILIPADEVSGGAKAAKVVAYLDQEAAEAFDDDLRVQSRAAVATIERVSMKLNKMGFMASTPKQRVAVVLAMEGNAKAPTTPEEKAFAGIKSATARAYYTSKIGIEDQDYKGNVIQARAYAGELPTGPAVVEPYNGK